MAHSVEIGGIAYLRSGDAAAQVGYSSDYVTRLAREGKIEATRVGRTWFVNPISLENFSSNVNRDKVIRSEKLRSERQQERQEKLDADSVLKQKINASLRTPLVVEAAKRSTQIGAAMRSAGVMLTGILVGMVSYAGVGYLMPIASHLVAVNQPLQMLERFAGEFYLTTSSLPEHAENLEASVVLTFVAYTRGYIFGEDQKTKEDTRSGSEEGLLVVPEGDTQFDPDSVAESFSDEVLVTEDPLNQNAGVVTPVFRNETGDSYRFLLVPVNEDSSSRSP